MSNKPLEFDRWEFNVSEHFLSAIINGDETGLSDEESALLASFLEEVEQNRIKARRGPGHWTTVGDGESTFTKCEVFSQGGRYVLDNCKSVAFMVPHE